MKFIKISLFIIGIFTFSNCYNYLSEEIPVVVHPKLDKRIPLLSIQVKTPEGEAERVRIIDLYTKYLEETGYFGRVISGGVRAPYHIEIYTAIVDEYENAWLTFGSGFFSIATAGLMPAFSGERRVLRAKIYREDKLISERAYSQKHTTLYGLVFMFIWERGIEEAAEIGYNKEKNLIHNLVEDLNIY